MTAADLAFGFDICASTPSDFPEVVSTAGMMPKLNSGFAFHTLGDSAEPEIIGTWYFWQIGCTAMVEPLVYGPNRVQTSSCTMSLSAASAPVAGLL